LPADLRAEISRFVTAQVSGFVPDVLARPELDPFVQRGNTITPRPIARAIIGDLLRDPVQFLERTTGQQAGSP
jgi:hypothetical protein